MCIHGNPAHHNPQPSTHRAAISSKVVPVDVNPAVPLPPYNNATFSVSYELGAPIYFSRKMGYAPSGGDGMFPLHG